MSKAKVFYNQAKHSTALGYGLYEFDRDDLVEMPVEFEWEGMGYVEDFLERIFAELNGFGNPLMSDENQEWIRQNMSRGHTSMSIGDAIEIHGQLYVVSEIGFTKVEELEEGE